MDLSVLVPTMPDNPHDLDGFAELVGPGAGDARRLWQGQSVVLDPLQSFAHTAARHPRLPVGLCVTLMPLKSPYQAAMEARSLARICGADVVYGIGPGPVLFQELAGGRYVSQLGAVRDYAMAVRALLDGGSRESAVSESRFAAGLPLHAGLTGGQVRLGLGVLRPRMAQVAGELADVAITWLTPADYVANTLTPALDAGAARVGRHRPRVVCVVPVAVRRPGRQVGQLVLASNYGHLMAPHYQDMLGRAGIAVDPGRPHTAVRGVLEGNAFLYGDLDSVVERLAAYAAAGADEVVLNVSGVAARHGLEAAVADLVEILGATAQHLTDRRP